MQRPTFTLTAGDLRATRDRPAGGLVELVVERDMDIPVDALRVLLQDRRGVALGDAVTLALGHDGDEQRAFTGSVAALRPTLEGALVFALGTLNALVTLRTSALYQNQAAGDIVSDLASSAGVDTGTIAGGPSLPRWAIDARSSAFQHARELADRLGYELYADRDGKLMFHPLGPDASLDAGGPLAAAGGALAAATGGGGPRFVFGEHLLGARATRRPAAWSSVAVGGESPMSGQGDRAEHWLTTDADDYRGADGSGQPRLLVLDAAARTKDLAERFAAGRRAAGARGAHHVRITTLGRAELDLGDGVSVGGTPDALARGSGYVRALRHRYSAAAGFVTEARVRVGGDA